VGETPFRQSKGGSLLEDAQGRGEDTISDDV